MRASLNGRDDEIWLKVMTSSQPVTTTTPTLKWNNDWGQTSEMGGTKLIILDAQDEGQNSKDFIEPTRSCLIIFDIQDQGWISEFLIEPTQNRSR